MNYDQALSKLTAAGQEHVMQYYGTLNEEQKESLLTQIENTDFSVLGSLEQKDGAGKRGKITPLAAMQLPQIREKEQEFRQIGIEAIRAGKVGAVLLAGGMGTRLGSDNPKGMYNIGLTKEVYIFQRLIENLFDVVREPVIKAMRLLRVF